MTRATSIQAWERINQDRLLPRMRLKVYNWLYEHGPATAMEIEEGMPNKYAHVRLHELRRQGVVRETRTRPCRITQQEVIEWDVTDALPSPLKQSGLKVRELTISVLFHPDSGFEVDEDAIEAMFPEMLDYDIRRKIRDARDRELILMRRQDGDES